MIPRVHPDYFIEISVAENPADRVRSLPDTYEIRINDLIWIVVLPWFPLGSWPDELPVDEEIQTREQFAWCAASPASIVIAPAEDGVETREVIARRDVHGATNTIFWLEPARHRRIADEIAARLERPSSHLEGRSTRLSALKGTELERFLTEDLPLAEFTAYERELLFLS